MQTKLILLAVITVSFMACNNADTSKINSGTVSEEQVHQHNASQDDTHELTLNNGVKWKTDESTRTHASMLNTYTDRFEKQTSRDLAAYHAFADQMQDQLQQLINGCKMEGADHDALHLWLEPVLKDVKALKNTSSTDEGDAATITLTEDVRKFDKYFD